MPEYGKIMLNTAELIKEISNCGDLLIDQTDFKRFFSIDSSKAKIKLMSTIFSVGFCEKHKDLFQVPKIEGKILTDLIYARKGKNAVIGLRYVLAESINRNFELLQDAKTTFSSIFDENKIKIDFEIKKIEKLEKLLRSEPGSMAQRIKPNSRQDVINELKEKDKQLDIVRKTMLFLCATHRYSDFFWWLFVFAILQEDILSLYSHLPRTQYAQMMDYFMTKDKDMELLRHKPMVSIKSAFFGDIRRKMIETAQGEIIISGSSNKNAFDRSHERSISECLKIAIEEKRLTKISILITDPIIFDDDGKCGDPISDIQSTISSLENGFYALCEEKGVELYVYFLPLLQIDHTIITQEFMLFRSNKLWNYTRKFKGSYTCHVANYYTSEDSEYLAHLEYLETIMDNSTIIFPEVDIDDTEDESSKARNLHMQWRKHLRSKGYTHIRFYKVYYNQIRSYVKSSWYPHEKKNMQLIPNSKMLTYEDFFNAANLLNDDTQKVLLPYIKETEQMLTDAIKKHDRSDRSYCHIYPSLDLGFPNNVQRLAGGFATGMLVTWECGIDIVPVDATVNVCTSSVFKLDHFDEEYLDNHNAFYQKVDEYAQKASAEMGYSFSFTSGNHFLMIAKDPLDQSYYLVLHSSANELKHSHMGLYPVEGNWYSKKIKFIMGNNNRYLRYLKDEDARYFIHMAKNFQTHNEQIHQWVAETINETPFENDEKWIKHHYYMPTDQSIALGTFVEPIGAQVPVFSKFGKPIYIFEIGKDNFQVDLGGSKGKVCLVPHGWGQKIIGITHIGVEDNQLLLDVSGSRYELEINSQNHIICNGKAIRDFKDGQDFLKSGHHYINGKFVKTLIPCIEYSRNTIGKGK